MSYKDFTSHPNQSGYFGHYGGMYVGEVLVSPLKQLQTDVTEALADQNFWDEYKALLTNYVGRATPCFLASRLSKLVGNCEIWLKREDLTHTGAHKINNTIGQAILAKRQGKQRLIAETGAGQHGVATATVAALFGFECKIFMGEEDIRRQQPNVQRMKLLGAEVVPVQSGTGTLKDAMNEALRYWSSVVNDTFYVVGTVAGPHPYPLLVRELQKIISEEARSQMLELTGNLPTCVVASVGGGSNAMGMFFSFLNDLDVELVGVEAAGKGIGTGEHAASLNYGSVGVLHGAKSKLLQDKHGQIHEAYSVSAGLDYPGVGPEHAMLYDSKRARYETITDDEAISAFQKLCKYEGIIPALESSHALAQAMKETSRHKRILVCLSGRGDKDLQHVASIINNNI
ncbi:MAG: tryptophan synthase subunit beta [Thermoguttaceae bacterium]